jgi:hypothetical protein
MSLRMDMNTAVKALQNDLETGARGAENSWSVFGSRLASAIELEINARIEAAFREYNRALEQEMRRAQTRARMQQMMRRH